MSYLIGRIKGLFIKLRLLEDKYLKNKRFRKQTWGERNKVIKENKRFKIKTLQKNYIRFIRNK